MQINPVDLVFICGFLFQLDFVLFSFSLCNFKISV